MTPPRLVESYAILTSVSVNPKEPLNDSTPSAFSKIWPVHCRAALRAKSNNPSIVMDPRWEEKKQVSTRTSTTEKNQFGFNKPWA
jgi:hypothetical protein